MDLLLRNQCILKRSHSDTGNSQLCVRILFAQDIFLDVIMEILNMNAAKHMQM